jgi:hypothetical protein
MKQLETGCANNCRGCLKKHSPETNPGATEPAPIPAPAFIPIQALTGAPHAR